jgi:DNA-binding response OmpR family regulator
MPRVLLVEDHPRMTEAVAAALQAQGIACDGVGTLRQAAAFVEAVTYDALILDRGLPDGDGLVLLAQLRALRQSTPCLVLTARDALNDRVAGLESGADDYLTKPFEMAELVARTKALLRRSQPWTPAQTRYGDLVVSPADSTLAVGRASITLSATELQILLALIRGKGQVVRRSALEFAAWGAYPETTPKALDVAIHRLRGKLAALASGVSITNAKGVGYALALAEDA